MTTFKKIYTADYSAEGYRDGVHDGKLAKPKSYFGVLKINFANFIWRYHTAHDSYCDNYNKGYEKGQRVRENIYTQGQPPSGSIGENMKSYRQQINGIQQCIDALNKDKRLFDASLENYQHQISTAESAGFKTNYTNPLKQKGQRLKNKTDEIITDIDILIENLEYFKTKLETLERESNND